MNTRYLIGKQYKTATGIIFKIGNIESYPKTKVSDRYKAILAIKPGCLVAISFRGHLIPNMTLEEGVGRLTAVEIDGKPIKGASAISKAIGIDKPMIGYSMSEI